MDLYLLKGCQIMMNKQEVSRNLIKYLGMGTIQPEYFNQGYRYHIHDVCLNLSEYECMMSNVILTYMLEVQEINHVLVDGLMCVIHYELSITNRESDCVNMKHIMKLLQFEEDFSTIKASWTYLDQCDNQEVWQPVIS